MRKRLGKCSEYVTVSLSSNFYLNKLFLCKNLQLSTLYSVNCYYIEEKQNNKPTNTHLYLYFRNLTEIIDILRHQYQGSLPLISIETFVDKVEDIYRKSCDIDEKLNEIEDLRSDLMTKHTIYKQILDLSSTKCLEDDDTCPHKLKNIINVRYYYKQNSYFYFCIFL